MGVPDLEAACLFDRFTYRGVTVVGVGVLLF
jgi:hypothetical protein